VASLKDIRRRIGSVKNTQQITKAMKMVAAAKLRRAQQAITSARPYAERLESITQRVIGEIQEAAPPMVDEQKYELFLRQLHPLLSSGSQVGDAFSESDGPQKVALLVVSSDRGLCGAYNSNALKFAWKRYSELKASSDVSVFFIGKRGHDLFLKRGVRGTWFEDFWSGRFNVAKCNKVADELTGRFLNGEFSKVVLCYTRFKSVISQSAEDRVLLPLKIKTDDVVGKGDSALPFVYEPEKKLILDQLLPSLVKTQVYRVLADSLASEFGARMTSMDNATKNAGEMISKLSLVANRVRQASITKELMEIVGGAEALKG
jgi:F-type H+-transporting ATPase subunit gamma